MSPSQTGGWQDDPEDEREWESPEDTGKFDPWEGWPEDMSGPEYWLNKRSMERGEL